MADVFVSYKQDERSAVEQIATRLRDLGLSVWFDASVSAGESFSEEIDREARSAKAMLVCWSPGARESRWVRAEAMIGFEHDKLAACYVSGPDGFSPPTPFNSTHSEDLRAWLASPSDAHTGWRSILRRIGKLVGRSDIETWGALDPHASTNELRNWLVHHESSPLFTSVETALRAREGIDAERARLEQLARARVAADGAPSPPSSPSRFAPVDSPTPTAPLTDAQRRILMFIGAAAVLAILFPPWIQGRIRCQGLSHRFYGFLLDPSWCSSVTIDVPILAMELLVIGVVGGIIFAMAKR